MLQTSSGMNFKALELDYPCSRLVGVVSFFANRLLTCRARASVRRREPGPAASTRLVRAAAAGEAAATGPHIPPPTPPIPPPPPAARARCYNRSRRGSGPHIIPPPPPTPPPLSHLQPGPAATTAAGAAVGEADAIGPHITQPPPPIPSPPSARARCYNRSRRRSGPHITRPPQQLLRRTPFS